jgi:hypothetical protein
VETACLVAIAPVVGTQAVAAYTYEIALGDLVKDSIPRDKTLHHERDVHHLGRTVSMVEVHDARGEGALAVDAWVGFELRDEAVTLLSATEVDYYAPIIHEPFIVGVVIREVRRVGC